MNKLLLATLIAGTGAITCARLTVLARLSRAAATQAGADRLQVVSQAKALTASAAELQGQLEIKRAQLNAAAAAAPKSADTPGGRSSGLPKKPSAKDIARLRQQFGLGWNNSPDYVLVSKAALKQMYLMGLDLKGTLTPTACAILGLTASERDTIEAAVKRVEGEYYDWVKTAMQRVEPAGDVLADYRLPANPMMAARFQAEGMALLGGTVGMERGELIVGCSAQWQLMHGELGQKPVRFTVRRHADGQQPPLWTLLQVEGGSSQGGSVRAGTFPDLLRPVFPGGWRDLAQREGFTLPEGVE
jgi:hypothetical protein